MLELWVHQVWTPYLTRQRTLQDKDRPSFICYLTYSMSFRRPTDPVRDLFPNRTRGLITQDMLTTNYSFVVPVWNIAILSCVCVRLLWAEHAEELCNSHQICSQCSYPAGLYMDGCNYIE